MLKTTKFKIIAALIAVVLLVSVSILWTVTQYLYVFEAIPAPLREIGYTREWF